MSKREYDMENIYIDGTGEIKGNINMNGNMAAYSLGIEDFKVEEMIEDNEPCDCCNFSDCCECGEIECTCHCDCECHNE